MEECSITFMPSAGGISRIAQQGLHFESLWFHSYYVLTAFNDNLSKISIVRKQRYLCLTVNKKNNRTQARYTWSWNEELTSYLGVRSTSLRYKSTVEIWAPVQDANYFQSGDLGTTSLQGNWIEHPTILHWETSPTDVLTKVTGNYPVLLRYGDVPSNSFVLAQFQHPILGRYLSKS